MTRARIEVPTDFTPLYKGERGITWNDAPSGERWRAWLSDDPDASLADYDAVGEIAWASRNHEAERPRGFDGAARKLTTRSGPAWWQPPEDIKRDPEAIRRMFDYVQGFYLEHWTYVTLHLEYEDVPCTCCGLRWQTHQSLGAIESNSGADYFRETLSDLLADAQHEADKRGKP